MTVTAIVRNTELPLEAPDELAPFVKRVEHDGKTIGFGLDHMARLMAHDDDARYAGERFAEWRMSFETAINLGDRPLVESWKALCLELAATFEEKLGMLEEIDFAYSELDADDAEILAVEVQMARRWIADSPRTGWGLVDASDAVGQGRGPLRSTGHIRTGFSAVGRALVSVAGGAEVYFEEDRGMLLVEDGQTTEVRGWRISGTGTELIDPAGDRPPHEVSEDAALAFQRLMPSAEAVRVRTIPLSSVFALTTVGLEEAARRATEGTKVLLVTDLIEGPAAELF